jgi:hypothetical protein
MTSWDFQEWMIKVRQWADGRDQLLGYEAQHGFFPNPDSMFNNDDWGSELLREALALEDGPLHFRYSYLDEAQERP